MSEPSVRKTVARALAQLGPDEDWPTNEALGGNPTGTRDDEFRASMLDDADAVLAAVADHGGLADVLREHGRDHTAVVGDDLWCATCDRIVGHADHREDHHAAHLADVIRAWLRGES